jgi:hydroxyquinol 1,2-dioxygenase
VRNFDETTITDAVLQRVKHAANDRMRQISEALVRHLHAFVREIEPTQAEWETGIDFLTRTGQMCDDNRHEFILLSDTLGVSMLVDAINHRTPQGATETTLLGPFFIERAPEQPLGADISGNMQGDPLFVTGTVSTSDGRPLSGATVDVWHSDNDGHYDVQQLDRSATLRCGRGFAPMRKAASGSGRSGRPPIPFPMTDRSARCSRPRAATPGAPRTFIS